MSVLLLLSSYTPGRFLRTIEQRIAASAGLLGLSYAACYFFWHFYGGLLYSRWLTFLFYVGWKVIAGLFLAMLVCTLYPRNIRVLLWISGIALTVFSVLVILSYSTGRLIGALIFPSMSIGLICGISLHCRVLIRDKAAIQEAKIGEQSSTAESAGKA